jgi:MFS family permease
VFVTVSLSKTFFFDASTSAARPKVLLYLLVTMAPFALVAPVIGPLLDRSRGGRRILFSVSMLGRAVLCFVLATMVDLDNVLVFPLVFLVLVLAKAQSVAKSALVPAVIGDPTELVRANSRLSIIAIFGGAAVAPFAAALVQVGPEPVLFMASIFFLVGSIAAFGVPRAKKVGLPETPDERALLHAPSILTAGTAMALLRGVVGFFTFFAAFALKKEGEPAWMFGLVLVGSAVGNAVGTVIAPLLRKKFREEWILAGALLAPALPLAWAARNYNRGALVVAAFAVATAAACGRVAFDSLLQRDGAEAARGRAFARFETRFQLVWVGGGVLAVLYPGGGRGGIFFVAIVLLFAGLSYVGKVRRLLVRNPAQPEAPPD